MSVNVQERFELLKILGSKFCTVGTLTEMITMTMDRILVQVTIYYRHRIGRDGNLDRSRKIKKKTSSRDIQHEGHSIAITLVWSGSTKGS